MVLDTAYNIVKDKAVEDLTKNSRMRDQHVSRLVDAFLANVSRATLDIQALQQLSNEELQKLHTASEARWKVDSVGRGQVRDSLIDVAYATHWIGAAESLGEAQGILKKLVRGDIKGPQALGALNAVVQANEQDYADLKPALDAVMAYIQNVNNYWSEKGNLQQIEAELRARQDAANRDPAVNPDQQQTMRDLFQQGAVMQTAAAQMLEEWNKLPQELSQKIAEALNRQDGNGSVSSGLEQGGSLSRQGSGLGQRNDSGASLEAQMEQARQHLLELEAFSQSLIQQSEAAYATFLEGKIQARIRAKEYDLKIAEEEMEETRTLMDGWLEGMQDYYDKNSDYASMFKDLSSNVWGEFSRTLTASLLEGENRFGQFTEKVGKMLLELALQAAVTNIVGGLLGLFGGDSSKGGGSVKAGKNFVKNAHGNVLSGGSLASFANSVVTSPTAFSFSGEHTAFSPAGLMGESGAEAIMPLVRTSSGDLGVRAQTGQGEPPVVFNTINVTTAPGLEVERQERENESGGFDVELLITRTVNDSLNRRGGELNRTMRNRFGARERMVGR